MDVEKQVEQVEVGGSSGTGEVLWVLEKQVGQYGRGDTGGGMGVEGQHRWGPLEVR